MSSSDIFHQQSQLKSAHCIVHNPSLPARASSPQRCDTGGGAAAIRMWNAIRSSPAAHESDADICEVHILASSVEDAYSMAVEHIIQNNLEVGERAYEGIIQCNLHSAAKNKKQHHVRALVMWGDANIQHKQACMHIFARHGPRMMLAQCEIHVQMVTPRTFTRIWQRVHTDGGIWEDMAGPPSSDLALLGADEGEQVVDAVGEGLFDSNGDVLARFLLQDSQ